MDGGGGIGTKTPLPSMDLSNLSNIEIPDWLKWIGENKDLILIISGIAGAIGLVWKGLKLIADIKGVGSVLGLFKKAEAGVKGAGIAIKGFGSALKGLSFIKLLKGSAIIIGVIEGIKALVEAYKSISKASKEYNDIGVITQSTFDRIVDSMQKILELCGGSIGQMISFGLELLQITDKNHLAQQATDKYKEALDKALEAEKEATTQKELLISSTGRHLDAIKKQRKAKEDLTKIEKENGITAKSLQEQIDKGTLSYDNMNAKQIKVYEAYLKEQSAEEQVKITKQNLRKETEEYSKKKEIEYHQKQKTIKASLEQRATLVKEGEDYGKLAKDIKTAMDKNVITVDEAKDLVELALADMSEENRKTFLKDFPDNFKSGLNPKKYEGAMGTLKRSLKNYWDGIKSWFGIGLKVKVPTGSSNRKGAVTYTKKGGVYLPKLATGGIINYPNHRCSIRSCNRWRKWSRRCHTFNR